MLLVPISFILLLPKPCYESHSKRFVSCMAAIIIENLLMVFILVLQSIAACQKARENRDVSSLERSYSAFETLLR